MSDKCGFLQGFTAKPRPSFQAAGDFDGHSRCTTGTAVVSQQRQTVKLLELPNYHLQGLIGYIRVKNASDGLLNDIRWAVRSFMSYSVRTVRNGLKNANMERRAMK